MPPKKARTIPPNIAEFFDVEAGEDREGEEEEENDGYDTEEALVPIDTEEVSEAGALIYSSMPQASLEAEAQHAEETAAAIVDRHRKRSAIVDDFRGLYRMPTHFELPPPPAEDAWKRLQEIHPEDAFRKLSLMPTHDLPKIWRVRIVEGYEQHVVLAITNIAIAHPRNIPVLSAFTLSCAPGWLYLEAPSPAEVKTALKPIPFIRRGPDGYVQPHVVPPEEWIDILSTSDPDRFPTHDKIPTWARIRKPGRYDRDLALVVDVGQHGLDSRLARVHVVPRLPYSDPGARPQKRKRRVRPLPAPFNPILAEQAGMAVVQVESLTGASTQGTAFRVGNDIYRDGLLELAPIPCGDLKCYDVSPLPDELEAFVSSFSSLARRLALATLSAHVVPLRANDRVKVVVGPLSPQQGVVVESSHASVVVLLDDPKTRVSISAGHLRRVFHTGASVKVVYGPRKGTVGFITSTKRADRAIEELAANPPAPNSRERSRAHDKAAADQAQDDEIAVIMLIESMEEIQVQTYYLEIAPDTNYAPQASKPGPSNIVPTPDPQREALPPPGDPYRHRVVKITKGVYKGHEATVLGSRPEFRTKGNLTTQLELDSDPRPINTTLDVVVTTTAIEQRVPLDAKACEDFQPKYPARCQTPPPAPPTFLIPVGVAPHAYTKNDASAIASGAWLLHKKLRSRRLDLRKKDVVQQVGENTHDIGFVKSLGVLRNVDDARISLVLGVKGVKFRVSPSQVTPMQTTEDNFYVPKDVAISISRKANQQVIVIGPDASGNRQYIGMVAKVVGPWDNLPLGFTRATITDGGLHQFTAIFIHETSLCRSNDPENVLYARL